MLSEAEKRRYRCHILLSEIGESGQEMLKAAKVLVVGAGGLGAPVLQYLTAAGIGKIGILDYDLVKEENLHRQILYGGYDLGKLKTIISRQKLSTLNPYVNFEIINIRLKIDNAVEIISQYDVIVDATDDDSSNYLINDACIIAGKPWIYASLNKYEGYVSTFNFLNGPSLRCIFPETGNRNSFNPSKEGLLGILPGTIGSFQATEVIKSITKIGTPLIGKLLIYNMLDYSIKILNFEKKLANFNISSLRSGY